MRRGAAQRRSDYALTGGRRGGTLVRARRQLGRSATVQFRGARRQTDADGSATPPGLRRGNAAQVDRARAPGISGGAGALVLFELAGWRMAELRDLRRNTVPQAGERRLARG